jgi:hypothetical protein
MIQVVVPEGPSLSDLMAWQSQAHTYSQISSFELLWLRIGVSQSYRPVLSARAKAHSGQVPSCTIGRVCIHTSSMQSDGLCLRLLAGCNADSLLDSQGRAGYLVLGGLTGAKVSGGDSPCSLSLKAPVSAASLKETGHYAAACWSTGLC